MILCLGLTSSGKTLLLKKLTSYPKEPDSTRTVPTVGTNLVQIHSIKSKKSLLVMEIGGEMVPLWPQYFRDCLAIIYVIDFSFPNQIGPNCIQLLKILGDEHIGNIKEVLIVLNKTQTSGPLTFDDAMDALLVEDIRRSYPKSILQTIRCDISTGEGIGELKDWLDLQTQKFR